ncbi:LytR/AlgR family response regulator transcription factor [Shewanella violacea]|uniref:Response regulator, AlgR/AgrA/LytR family n=1 Tax=Shewanella violacea (strain JCM 10179 / CIP 106290 / LMG 19151 / DSS12) TaxID=637905 RepID=D4ZFC4_SHEVD|nr:LytTR family DNA-binding domain-containing protein [Shewanella violacea]BAJ04288.1 response regulator, AlgR/AgrA/LytR family [Shewanella violacea DSS12]
MANILIAEDEEILRTSLQFKLNKYWPQANIISSVATGTDALKALNSLKPDVAFLDIQMGDLTGIEVVQQTNHNFHAVFITAYDKYAIEAFDAGAIDYLLKPYSDQRLKDCIERVNARLSSVPADIKQLLSAIPGNREHFLNRIKIQIGNKFWLLSVDDIICFKACGRYVRVLTKDREALVRLPLKHLLSQLNPDIFWQIHRSTVINVEHLDHVQTADGEQLYALMKKLDEPLPVSRSYSYLFRSLSMDS